METERSSLSYKHHLGFWAGVCVLLLIFLWALQGVLLPFVLGLAIAYLLSPIVANLGQKGVNRTLASVLILSTFVLILCVIVLAVGPVLYKEVAEFSRDLPEYIDQLESKLGPYIDQLRSFMGQKQEEGFSGLGQYAGGAAEASKVVLGGLVAGGAAIGGFFSLLVLTPIIAFFMMRDWPQIVNWIEGLVPVSYKETIMDLLSQIDRKISGFVRGQILVAVILGVFYALACSIAGLKYGLVIGLIAGVLNIIPMLGSITGFVLGVSVAYVQTGELSFVAIIAGIFLFGQVVEGNFLTPKLVGDRVGLHPLWVFFALMAGGALLGITGMLIAVPVVAIFGVLIGFAIEQYKKSGFYSGEVKEEISAPEKEKSKKASTKKVKTSKKASDKA